MSPQSRKFLSRPSMPIVMTLFLLLTSFDSQPLAQNVNFTNCYLTKVLKLNNTDRSDVRQCFKLDPNGVQTHLTEWFLSLLGCEELCGTGFQWFSGSVVAYHLSLFIIPLLILSIRVSFAPAGISNSFWMIIHLIADPIDSMWSTLTRQEKALRNYNYALEIAPVAAREIAAIWTAYDQWLQDPIPQFTERIKSRNLLTKALRSGERPGINRISTNLSDSHGRRIPDNPSLEEIYHIKKAANELTYNRGNNPIWSLFALIVFVVSLALGYIHLATTHTTDDVSHVLAVMTLFFFLPFAVYTTGTVGNFKSSDKVSKAIFELRKTHEGCGELFPEPKLISKGVNEQILPGTSTRSLSWEQFAKEYDEIQTYSGINSSWRFQKTLSVHIEKDSRSAGKLFLFSFMVIVFCWIGAFTLSFLTPRRAFNCHALTWTVITATWLISPLLNYAMKYALIYVNPVRNTQKKPFLTRKRAWWLFLSQMSKDMVLAIGILVSIILSQTGVYNSCKCRAGTFLTAPSLRGCAYINLGDPSDNDRDANWRKWLAIPTITLLLITGIVFWSGYEGEGGKLLYLRTSSEQRAELRAIQDMRTRLDHEKLQRKLRQQQAEEQAESNDEGHPHAGTFGRNPGNNDDDGEENEHQHANQRRSHRGPSSGELSVMARSSRDHLRLRQPLPLPSSSLSPGRAHHSGGSGTATPLTEPRDSTHRLFDRPEDV